MGVSVGIAENYRVVFLRPRRPPIVMPVVDTISEVRRAVKDKIKEEPTWKAKVYRMNGGGKNPTLMDTLAGKDWEAPVEGELIAPEVKAIIQLGMEITESDLRLVLKFLEAIKVECCILPLSEKK